MSGLLLVSPRSHVAESVRARLSSLGLPLRVATGDGAFDGAADDPPLSVLLDWEEPEAPELLARWTAELDLRQVPVVVLGGPGSLAPALDGGAADHVDWPLQDAEVLIVRLRNAQRRFAEIEGLRQLASHDPLTGVLNRRAFSERLEYEFAQVHRYGGELSLAIVDLDHFKQINDTYGHDVGDLVLKQIAGQLARQLRETDTLARYGGEEFVCLMPMTARPGALLALERLRESVVDGQWGYTGNPLEVTFSAGVADFASVGTNRAAALLKAADLALYRAKAAGRDRVVVWEPEGDDAGA